MPDLSDPAWIGPALALVILLAPVALVVVLGVSSLAGRYLSEGATHLAGQAAAGTGFTAAAGMLTYMLWSGERHVVLRVGDWFAAGDYRFAVKFLFDRLSIPMVLLSFGLCGVIGKFAVRYLHRERGYNRFFTLFALFQLGMVVASVAGTVETLFAGWELVGLSSVLLIAFFQERAGPARNGFRVWVVYRVSDAALLVAAVALHNLSGGGDFDQLLGAEAWPDGRASLSHEVALPVGLLLLLAAAGKSGLVPFSGWLPRAMEGPTPSSAVFYGALSVHLGAYLLLRVSPLLALSAWLAGAVVAVGLATAVVAAVTARVQTDIKSALSFASLSQVGLIVAEIGLGWHYVPLAHLVGHACLRTLQFVRAPTLLHDYHGLENAIGGHLAAGTQPRFGWLYRVAMERAYLDVFLDDYVVTPFVRLARGLDALERRWGAILNGRPAAPPAGTAPVSFKTFEDAL